MKNLFMFLPSIKLRTSAVFPRIIIIFLLGLFIYPNDFKMQDKVI